MLSNRSNRVVPPFKKNICVFHDVISHIDLVNIWKNAHFPFFFCLNDSYMIWNLNYKCSLLMTIHWWWCCTGLICYFVFWRRQYGKNSYFSCLICLFDSQMWWDPYNKVFLQFMLFDNDRYQFKCFFFHIVTSSILEKSII